MTSFFFLEGELLGAIRARSATFLSLAVVSLFLFLGCFASLFLIPSPRAGEASGAEATKLVAYVSPRLSTTSVNSLFLRLQERADVLSVKFDLPEEVTSDRTGGTFTLVARSADAVTGLVDALRATDGITSVEKAAATGGLVLSSGARIGLLCGLAVCALLSLLLARAGFHSLLSSFRNEIRMMRLSGVPEREILAAVVVAGLLVGFLAGLLLIVGLALYTLSVTSGTPEALDVTRLIGVGVVSLLLGMLMGGLMGLLGAGHLGSSRFSPIS